MTEQERRNQIVRMRQQASQQRPAVSAMSDAEANALQAAHNDGSLTQEQMIAAAMLGKMIQGGVNDIRKQGIGDLKISNVDMSKVMPSGIVRAAGMGQTPQPPVQVPRPPVQAPPVAVDAVNDVLFPAAVVPEIPIPMVPVLPLIQASTATFGPVVTPSNQSEFNFNRQAKYEDILQAVEKLEDRVIILTGVIKDLQLSIDKKKLKNPITHGKNI